MSALWNWSDLLAKINSAALQGGVRLEVLPTRHPDYRVVKSADMVVIIHGEPDSKFSWSDSDGNCGDGNSRNDILADCSPIGIRSDGANRDSAAKKETAALRLLRSHSVGACCAVDYCRGGDSHAS